MGDISLLEYTDYRVYLRDFYQQQKTVSVSFSYRVFAMRAKLASPNYLKLVIDGSRRITDRTLPNFIRGLRLSRTDADYFKNLVFYQESEDTDAKAMHLRELVKIRNRGGREERTIEKDRLDILRTWHPWVIREMLLLKDFRPDPEWISRRLRHKVTPAEAQEALGLLERLEFIKRKPEGGYSVSDPLVTTGDETSGLFLRNLYCHFFELAIQSILRDPREVREFCGITIAIPKARVSEVKELLRDFRLEINKRFSQTEGNDEVYNLAIGFFPLTKEIES